jgi:hypothetical protein
MAQNQAEKELEEADVLSDRDIYIYTFNYYIIKTKF